MKSFKWGVLGPGSIAGRFSEGLAVLANAERYAVGSRDLKRAHDFATKHGFQKAYGSYEELAKDPDVDIVYVSTLHPQHESAVILCLSHGKHVICEKPFAVNARQAVRMIDCAKENERFLMEAMWSRFLPTLCKTRELLTSGAIGSVRHVEAIFCFKSGFNPESRLFAPELAGGALLDVGVYNLALCSMVYGEQPNLIQSHMSIGTTGVDEITEALLSYPGGQTASLLSAIQLNTPHDAFIYGDDGYIKLPNYWRGNIVILVNGGGTQEFSLPFESNGMQFEAAEVMSCLDRGLLESSIMPLDETLKNLTTSDRLRADNGLRYPFEED